MVWIGFEPIILIENPKYSGNIGMICRLIANFGLKPLRILGEKKDFHFEMEWMAYNSEKELELIEYYQDFESISRDLDLVIGTTMIHGEDRGRFVSLSDIGNLSLGKKYGVFFGREDTGLSRDTAIKCDMLVDFRLPGYQKSMNLSHSVSYVISVLYNTVKHQTNYKIDQKQEQNLNHFYQYSERIFKMLEMSNFHNNEFLPVKRLKSIFGRSKPSKGDIGFFYKIFQQIEYKLTKEK
jgi:tRNA/rRNA methyltransferase